jgi:hypothetical protein
MHAHTVSSIVHTLMHCQTPQIGMALFPDDPYIIIVYSNFLISVQENYQVRSVL